MYIYIHTTFINRNNTNEFVFQKANEAVGSPHDGPLRKIIPLTEVLETKRLKLLGHILRRPRAHPQHQVTFASSLALPKVPLNRRVGRPGKNWTIENMRKAWETLQNVEPTHPNLPFDHWNRNIREKLIESAIAYTPPFN